MGAGRGRGPSSTPNPPAPPHARLCTYPPPGSTQAVHSVEEALQAASQPALSKMGVWCTPGEGGGETFVSFVSPAPPSVFVPADRTFLKVRAMEWLQFSSSWEVACVNQGKSYQRSHRPLCLAHLNQDFGAVPACRALPSAKGSPCLLTCLRVLPTPL